MKRRSRAIHMLRKWQPLGEPVMVSKPDAKRLSELRLGLIVNRTVPLMFDDDIVVRALHKLKDHPLPWEGFAE
jgi:hypothetical protein